MIQQAKEGNVHIVWIDANEKIVSFRFIKGYDQQIFINHDVFMDFLFSLQVSGYRFQ